jgi:anti-sigma factor RsiW
MSECTSFRADLDAFRDGLLGEELSQQMQRHIESCDSCRAQAKQAEAIEAGVRANAAEWFAPDHLWSRIQNSANNPGLENRRRSHRKPWSWAVAAMLVVAVVVVGFDLNRQAEQKSMNSVASVLVNEFHTFAVSHRNLDYIDSEPKAIRQWFGDKVDFRVPLPTKVSGLNLAGGRLCNMLNQRVASYMYQSDGAWVSLYIMKSGQGLDRDFDAHLSLRGYGYIEWVNEGLHYSLVGDISIVRLRQIADTIYRQQFLPESIQSTI